MNEWINILSSAAIIAGLVYLVRFLGSSMADHKPYSDDREWDINLFGVTFLIHWLLPWSVIGFALARYFPLSLDTIFLRLTVFVLLSMLLSALLIMTNALGEKFYRLKSKPLKPFNAFTVKTLHKKAIQLNPYLPSFILITLFSYVLTNYYYTNHPVWLVITSVEMFSCIWLLAIRISYQMLKKERSNITLHLKDGVILENVILLKLNPTNIRIRDCNTVKIINMEYVKMLEAHDMERSI